MTNTVWTCKKFDDLLPQELYAILQLRNEVFVIEQQCFYQDCDDRDAGAFHHFAMQENKMAAYSRLFAPGIIYSESSIGRVVNSPSVRGSGMGKELMQKNIAQVYALFGKSDIRIGAQLYLKKFYESFGFVQRSDIYLEDNIQHILMVLTAA